MKDSFILAIICFIVLFFISICNGQVEGNIESVECEDDNKIVVEFDDNRKETFFGVCGEYNFQIGEMNRISHDFDGNITYVEALH